MQENLRSPPGRFSRPLAMRKQDELSRRRRLNRGACPTHGIRLAVEAYLFSEQDEPYAAKVGCPRRDCSFARVVDFGSKIAEVLNLNADCC